MLELAAITNYKQSGYVYDKKEEKNSKSKDGFYKKLGIITKEVAVGQVSDEFQETFKQTLSHFNVSYKRREWKHSGVEEVETYLPMLSTTRKKQSQCFALLTKKAKTNLRLEYFCVMYIQRN